MPKFFKSHEVFLDAENFHESILVVSLGSLASTNHHQKKKTPKAQGFDNHSTWMHLDVDVVKMLVYKLYKRVIACSK